MQDPCAAALSSCLSHTLPDLTRASQGLSSAKSLAPCVDCRMPVWRSAGNERDGKGGGNGGKGERRGKNEERAMAILLVRDVFVGTWLLPGDLFTCG